MRVHLLHGFNVSDKGAGTTDRLKPFLYAAGHEILDHDYGWFGLLSVRFLNWTVAERVKKASRDGDIGVGHSNGCAILVEAARRGARLRGLVLINPALDRSTDFPDGLEWVHVYHNGGDEPVKASRWLIAHPWGDMGNVGYCGEDARVVNFSGDYLEPRLSGHSDLFDHAKVGEWGERIARSLQAP